MEGAPELPGSPDASRANVSKAEPIAVNTTDPASSSEKSRPMSPGRPTSPGVSNISMPETKSGLIGVSSNLVNSIVGAGIIGIPYAMRQSGIVVGLMLLILVAYLTDKSLRIIIEVACFHPKLKHLGVLTYGTCLKMLQTVDDWKKNQNSYMIHDVLVWSSYYQFVAYIYFSQRISCQFPLVATVAILF
jgi:hypothetical protein